MNCKGGEVVVEEDGVTETAVYMWGYLPGVSPEKCPILSPAPVLLPHSANDTWKEVCGGGCGFAMAISGSGKLMAWGSANDEEQSYLTSGKHGETPEAFPLPPGGSCCRAVVKADAGWAHCATVTEEGEVYTWGWKECVPTTGVGATKNMHKANAQQVTPRSRSSTSVPGEEVVKRRRVSASKEDLQSSLAGDGEFFTTTPTPASMGPGVRITNVAAGGRHTLALSDVGQVWGWGYGGEGQLGLGSRITMVSSPHLIPCVEHAISGKERSFVVNTNSSTKLAGNRVKEIACGGRHSAVVTDTGELLTFGWGLYGQCGQGSTNDLLRPTLVTSFSGSKVEKVAAGLWHTICITADGCVYSFGGNQFGQLGTGADHSETRPKLVDAASLESKHVRSVSCGARHSATVAEDGTVFTWGWNKYGQLGLGDSIDRNIPSQVTIERCRPKNIACGWWHTLLLAEIPSSLSIRQ